VAEFSELPIPDPAKEDPKSFEILRVWMTKTGQYVILKPGITNDPAGWGLVLADIMGHIANAYAQVEGRDRSKTFERIRDWTQSYRRQRIDQGPYSRVASKERIDDAGRSARYFGT
jgi:hypothetical protein